MSDIDKIKGFQPKSEGGGLFLKLADGEEVKVRITSLPVIFENEFKMGDEINLSTRFGFTIWNHDAGRAQIWVTNAATYGQQITVLLDDEEYGDWRNYDVKIKRTGEKAQTRYHVRPGVKRYDLTKDQLDACEKIDLVETINKSDSAQHVMWLSEYRELEEKGGKEELKGVEKARATAKAIKEGKTDDEEVVEDIGDEPIDLKDIPF